jgi:hypothetical protein
MNMADIGFVFFDYLSDGLDCLFCEKRTPDVVINPKFKILAWIFQPLASGFLVGMIIVYGDIRMPRLFKKVKGIKHQLLSPSYRMIPITNMKNIHRN